MLFYLQFNVFIITILIFVQATGGLVGKIELIFISQHCLILSKIQGDYLGWSWWGAKFEVVQIEWNMVWINILPWQQIAGQAVE